MDNQPPDELKTGRLMAEDRRGTIEHEYLQPKTIQEKSQTLADPENKWNEQKNSTYSPYVMAAFITVALLSTAIFFSLSLSSKTPQNSTYSPPKAPPASPQNFIEKSTAAEIRNAIRKCVSGFMNASSNKERCQFIIGGDRLIDTLDEYYQRPQVSPPQDFGQIYQTDPAAFSGIPIRTVLALETQESTAWAFTLLPTQNEMKIDWESSVGYGQCSWAHFLESKPQTPVIMRTHLARATRDKQTEDPSKFGFCKIFIKGNDQSLPGFFPLKSPVASTLKRIVPPGGRQPVTVKLRWNEQGTDVEVVEVLHNFWINLAHYQLIFQNAEK